MDQLKLHNQNLMPIVDLALLLLLFFLATYRDGESPPVDLPQASETVAEKESPEKLIVDSKGEVFFETQPSERIAPHRIDAVLVKFANNFPDRLLQIVADSEVEATLVQSIVLSAQKAKIPVNLAVEELDNGHDSF